MAQINSIDKEAFKSRNLITIFTKGDIFSKLSYIICGLANIRNGQIVKGSIFFLLEVLYVWFMATKGIGLLGGLTTLGTKKQSMVFNENLGIYETVRGDNSMLILLFGVVAVVVTAAFIAMWLFSIHSGERARELKSAGKHVPGFFEDIKSLFNRNIHFSFLAIPVVGLLVFTVTPLITGS